MNNPLLDNRSYNVKKDKFIKSSKSNYCNKYINDKKLFKRFKGNKTTLHELCGYC